MLLFSPVSEVYRCLFCPSVFFLFTFYLLMTKMIIHFLSSAPAPPHLYYIKREKHEVGDIKDTKYAQKKKMTDDSDFAGYPQGVYSRATGKDTVII